MELLSNRLYCVEKPKTIVFEERRTDDVVNIYFNLKENQYGIYANEFKTMYAADSGVKKADLLILVIDEEKECFSSWVLDVKSTVGGEDVILHLVEQLSDSVKHKRSVCAFIEDFEEEQHIGYITQKYDESRIEETIRKKKFYLDKEMGNINHLPKLIGEGMREKLLKERAKLKLLIAFQAGVIVLAGHEWKLEKYISTKCGEKYIYDLEVACG